MYDKILKEQWYHNLTKNGRVASEVVSIGEVVNSVFSLIKINEKLPGAITFNRDGEAFWLSTNGLDVKETGNLPDSRRREGKVFYIKFQFVSSSTARIVTIRMKGHAVEGSGYLAILENGSPVGEFKVGDTWSIKDIADLFGQA